MKETGRAGRAGASPNPRLGSGQSEPGVPIRMGRTTFPIMKYSQVTASLRNDGDQSIAFQRVIFSPFRGLLAVLTVISARGRLDRSTNVALVTDRTNV